MLKCATHQEKYLMNKFSNVICSLQELNELDAGFTDIPKLISEEDVDILPYMDWAEDDLDSFFPADRREEIIICEPLSNELVTAKKRLFQLFSCRLAVEHIHIN